MPDQPPSDRFKTNMPQIPGVPRSSEVPAAPQLVFKPLRFIAFLAGLALCLFVVRWILRPKSAEVPLTETPPQVEIPPTTADSSVPPPPRAAEAEGGVANVPEMTRPWTSRDFSYRNRLTGETVSAILVRLPAGSAGQPSGYWAFSTKTPFGNCQFEYINDLQKLRSDYGYAAKHPMVGNPCTRSVFDPLKMTSIPGGVWVRGAIVQGSDLRPPLGIEVQVHGDTILAVRME